MDFGVDGRRFVRRQTRFQAYKALPLWLSSVATRLISSPDLLVEWRGLTSRICFCILGINRWIFSDFEGFSEIRYVSKNS